MSLYFLGVLVALISLLFYAPTNIFDSYLSNRPRISIPVIVFFNTVMPFVILPILLILGVGIPSSHFWIPIVIIALIEVFYQFPYLKAFQVQNTSTVAALFSIGKIITPALAYFTIGERISLIQYIGFFLIIATSLALSYSKSEKLKLNKSFFYMLAVSLSLVAQSLLYKYTFEHMQWSTSFFWTTLLSGVIVIVVFFIFGKWADLKETIRDKKVMGIMIVNNLFNTVAESLGNLSIALLPLTVAKGISSAHSLTVLGLSFITTKYFPRAVNKIYKESFNIISFLLYLTMVIGVIMVSVK